MHSPYAGNAQSGAVTGHVIIFPRGGPGACALLGNPELRAQERWLWALLARWSGNVFAHCSQRVGHSILP